MRIQRLRLQGPSKGSCLLVPAWLGQYGPRWYDDFLEEKKFAYKVVPNDTIPQHPSLGYDTYWGNLHKELLGVCDKTIYGWAQTLDFGWDYEPLMRAYATTAQETVAKNGLVVAHSMANSVMAGACMLLNICVPFVSLAAPFRGAASSSLVSKVDGVLQSMDIHRLGSVLTLATKYKYMMHGPHHTADGMVKFLASRPELLKGQLCGYKSWGSGGRMGLLLSAMREMAYGTFHCRHGSCLKHGVEEVECDGMVAMDECALESSSPEKWLGGAFLRDPLAQRFKFAGNHQDSTGASGNFDHMLDFLRKRLIVWADENRQQKGR